MKSKHLFITTVLIILSSSLTVGIKNTKAETSIEESSYFRFDTMIRDVFKQRHKIQKLPKLYSDFIKLFWNEDYVKDLPENYHHNFELLGRENHEKALQIIPEEIEQSTKELYKELNEFLNGQLYRFVYGGRKDKSVFYYSESYLKFTAIEEMICKYRSVGISDEIIQERLDEASDYIYRGIDYDIKRAVNYVYAGWEEVNNNPKYKKEVEDYFEKTQVFLSNYKKGVTSIMSFHVKSADRECRPNQPNYFVRKKDLQFLKRTLD